jgi:hypothetical protein
MSIEWLRRNMDKWDEELRTYLFTDGDITSIEEGAEGEGSEGENAQDNGLNIGDLK